MSGRNAMHDARRTGVVVALVLVAACAKGGEPAKQGSRATLPPTAFNAD
jgi:hypothetical protein